MQDKILLRYSRHIFLPEIDYAGQEKICNEKVLLIGVGGLGSQVALFLTAAGVKELHIVDDDKVELQNLQRQIIYTSEDENKHKVDAAKQRLKALNPDVNIFTHKKRFVAGTYDAILNDVDLIIDASDNFVTRYAMNQAHLQYQKPLVFGAAIGWQGQIAVFNGYKKNLPCYQCLFGDNLGEDNQRCSEQGVVGPLVGMVGSQMALDAIKAILNMHEGETYLTRIDALNSNFNNSIIQVDSDCKACGC